MNEKELLKISLISSLIGILILFFLTYTIKVNLYEINSLSKDNLDDIVRVKGIVQSFTETPGLYIVNLKDNTGRITVVIFKDEKLGLREGLNMEVIGNVVEYKNNIEIIAKEIVS